ncbi:MAG: flippase-like domain-containing protein [Deltaproteobacteria bacterium]|nr:flippase-like domain-containing protein [Deltaproteobacteria bacterium]
MTDGNNSLAPEEISQGPALWGWYTFVSLGVALMIIVGLAAYLDPQEIWREVVEADKKLLFLGALAHYATYPVRGLRWRRSLIHFPLQGGAGKFGLIVFFYNSVDNLVPAKLGDLYAAHLVRINIGVRRSAALGSLVFLRTADAWAVLFMAFVASWILFAKTMAPSVVWTLVAGGLIAVATSSVILVFIFLKKSPLAWLPEKAKEMVHAFHTGMWPNASEILPIALLTLVIWALETLWIFLLVQAFGVPISFTQAIFLTMVPILASAFPLTPSGAGLVEVTLFTCLRLVGIASPVAASLTVVNRLIDYWFHIILGLFTWAMRHVIGLRTWNEVPLEGVESPETMLREEAVRGG